MDIGNWWDRFCHYFTDSDIFYPQETDDASEAADVLDEKTQGNAICQADAYDENGTEILTI